MTRHVDVTQAVVLAAGQGTRLRPFTDDRPKPMLEVGGRPLIEHTILRLMQCGVETIIINLHHRPGVVRQHFGDGRRYGERISGPAEESNSFYGSVDQVVSDLSVEKA